MKSSGGDGILCWRWDVESAHVGERGWGILGSARDGFEPLLCWLDITGAVLVVLLLLLICGLLLIRR